MVKEFQFNAAREESYIIAAQEAFWATILLEVNSSRCQEHSSSRMTLLTETGAEPLALMGTSAESRGVGTRQYQRQPVVHFTPQWVPVATGKSARLEFTSS